VPCLDPGKARCREENASGWIGKLLSPDLLAFLEEKGKI
jgi:hypothetical protein